MVRQISVQYFNVNRGTVTMLPLGSFNISNKYYLYGKYLLKLDFKQVKEFNNIYMVDKCNQSAIV